MPSEEASRAFVEGRISLLKEEGGPAFPVSAELGDGSAYISPGMTLRDYFAALAMQGFVATNIRPIDPPETLARHAYVLADAMIEARRSPPVK